MKDPNIISYLFESTYSSMLLVTDKFIMKLIIAEIDVILVEKFQIQPNTAALI